MATHTVQPESPRRGIPPVALILGTLVAAALIIGGVYMMRRGGTSAVRPPSAPVKTRAATSHGNTAECALSPDGRFLAYTLAGQGALWVREVATAKDVRVLPPQKDVPYDLRFSPSGDFLYFLTNDPDRQGYKALFSIPSLGGQLRKLAYDVDSRVSFSPDGKQICFLRGAPQQSRGALIVLNLADSKERALTIWTDPVTLFPASPDWSPDGKRVAAVETRHDVGLGSSVVTFRVEDGRREPVGTGAWGEISDLAWLPDGSGLVISAFDRGTRTPAQLWTLTYPEGHVQRMKSDPGFYSDLTLSADGTTLAALRYEQGMNLWRASATDARDVRQITFAGADSEITSFDTGEAGRIYFDMFEKGAAQVWSIDESGSGLRAIASGPDLAFDPRFRPGVGIFYTQEDESLTTHVWRTDADSGNARPVTSGPGEALVDISPDGQTVLFKRDDTPNVLWSVSSDGGQPTNLGTSAGMPGTFSPDGKRVLVMLIHSAAGHVVVTPKIIPATGSGAGVTPALPPGYVDEAWTPDGKGFTYLNASDGNRKLFRLRLSGGRPEEVTGFTEGRIWQHRWSPDGTRLLIHRRVGDVDNLWVTDAAGQNPVAITDFKAGDITGLKWSRDGRGVVFMHGESSQDVALIRNFK